MRADFKNLHDFCVTCRKCRVAEKNGPMNPETKELSYKTGDFIVQCRGIPADYNYIPNFDSVKSELSKDELDYSRSLYDPVLWAKIHLGWEPRKSKKGVEYQSIPLRCTSKRKVLRWGRRTGKSDLLAITILHYLFTNSPVVKRWDENLGKYVDGFSTVLIIAPYLSQIKVLFERMNKLISGNTNLSNDVKREVANPYHIIELYNGAKVVGFPSGAKAGSGAESVRGQKADLIILDEMDYLREEDLKTVLAMLMEHSDVSLIAASTPTGRREYFWNFCKERMDFKEFHYTSHMNPSWNMAMELELREFYKTEIAWQHEVNAEFGEAVSGVFQTSFVDNALLDYNYEDMTPNSSWMYSIGVDWNDTANGTKLVVVGLNPEDQKFKIAEKVTVQKAGWTQTASITELVALNRKWHPQVIYVDEGYGSTQIEILKKLGLEAEFTGNKDDQRLKDIKAINLSSKIELFDPVTQLPVKEWIKPFMVNNAVRRFEQNQVYISKYDDVIYKQLLGYNVQKVTITGMPVYVAGSDGDHDLDAFMLALLGFTMELSEFTNRSYKIDVSIAPRFGERTVKTEIALATVENRKLDLERVTTSVSKPQLPENRSEIQLTQPSLISTIHSTRIYSHEAFNSDKKGSGFSSTSKMPFRKAFPRRRSF